jgi:hypothetical protein
MNFLNHVLLYIDPGTGSLLLQVISGGLIAFLMFFKKLSAKFTQLISKKDKDKNV